MQSIPENHRGPESSWTSYAIAALILVLGLFVLSVIGVRGGSAARQNEVEYSSVYSGDWDLKVYLFLTYLAKQRALPSRVDRGQALTQAVNLYLSAAKGPSPTAIRRAAITTYTARGGGALPIFARLQSPQVIKARPQADIRDLRGEVRMWTDIYTGRVSPKDAGEYAIRIRGLHLGPSETLALAQLYRSVGQNRLAEAAELDGEQRAAASVIAGTILIIVLTLAGLAGLGFIIVFFVRLDQRRAAGGLQPTETEPAEPERAVEPSVLLKAFIAYVGLIYIISLIARATLMPAILKLPSESRLMHIIAVEFGGSALSGLIALAVLYLLVHRDGATLDVIGLTRRNFRENLLWGFTGYCALLPLLLAAMLISNVIFHGIKTPANPVIPMLLGGDRRSFVVLFVLGTFLAPFFEEIFFRGVLYHALRARQTLPVAVVLSAAAFAMVHPQLPAGFLPIFVIGAVFAVLVETRRSLVPSMFAHALNNGVLFVMMYLISLV